MTTDANLTSDNQPTQSFDEQALTRFWSRVYKTDTCWLWQGYLDRKGYGGVKIKQKHYRVHRLAYMVAKGDIPDGLVLDHLCRVRNCVNPDHLEPVTIGVNTLRGDTITAHNLAKMFCPSGHPYDEINTMILSSSRHCRPCSILTLRRYRLRKKLAKNMGVE